MIDDAKLQELLDKNDDARGLGIQGGALRAAEVAPLLDPAHPNPLSEKILQHSQNRDPASAERLARTLLGAFTSTKPPGTAEPSPTSAADSKGDGELEARRQRSLETVAELEAAGMNLQAVFGKEPQS